ncbi:transposase [Dactylosporangium sp. McL0621]|uniref:transposase n=1 Tax=Dactylosporangium sp. McL0621 TaxID=3415678 RepID=UPI003CFA5A89
MHRRAPARGLSADASRAAQAIGRSRGGLTTKVHLLAEGCGRSLVKRLTAGQAADTKELVALSDAVAVLRPSGVDRHRTRLDHRTADKAYGSKANRRSLRARGLPHTIPQRADVRARSSQATGRSAGSKSFSPCRHRSQ